MSDKLKGLFIKDGQVKNVHVGEQIQNNNIENIDGSKIETKSINIQQLSDSTQDLLLPNKETKMALANSMNPNAANPFVTRSEFLSDTSYWKDPVSNIDQLPDANSGLNSINDVRFVVDEIKLYFWNGRQWLPIQNETTSEIISSDNSNTNQFVSGTQAEEGVNLLSSYKSKFDKNGIIFINEDFDLIPGEEYEITHDSDKEYTRIIQVKEKILNNYCTEKTYSFESTENYIITSNYSLDYISNDEMSVNPTTITSGSNILYGIDDVLWDTGIEGLIIQTEDGNVNRIQSVGVQNSQNVPRYILTETSFDNLYQGSINISNITVTYEESKLIRQYHEFLFYVLKNTDLTQTEIKKTQVLSNKETGMSAIATIKQDNKVYLSYNIITNCENTWEEYPIYYNKNDENQSIYAKDFYVVHLVTKPRNYDETDAMTQNDDINGNDMYFMVYIEQGTDLPYLISWCHNFGNPYFFDRISLDSSPNSIDKFYYDPHLAIRELKSVSNIEDMSAEPNISYVIAITCSKLYTNPDNNESSAQIALWINDNAGPFMIDNWPANLSPCISYIYGNVGKPKVLLGPPMARTDSDFNLDTPEEMLSDSYKIYIVYHNTFQKKLKCIMPYHTDVLDPFNWNTVSAAQDDLETVFHAGQFGSSFIGTYDACTNGELDTSCRINQSVHMYSAPSLGYFGNDIELFTNLPDNKRFSIKNSENFDAVIWEDRNEKGLQVSIDSVNDDGYVVDNIPVYCGVPVIVASNEVNGNQICVTYKLPISRYDAWTETAQETGKYGNKIKIKIEKKYERNELNKPYGEYYNSDIIHIMYINDNLNDGTKIPCHIHNRDGSWINEGSSDLLPTDTIYYSRQRNFSEPIQYLDFLDIEVFDFDINSIGQIEFVAFNNSDTSDDRGLYYANSNYKCKFAIWSSSNEKIENGPGARAGFVSFSYSNSIYIHGGYLSNGTVDGSAWRLDLSSMKWYPVRVSNSPKRVFHLSEFIKNVKYKFSASKQNIYTTEEMIFPEEAYGGIEHNVEGGGLFVSLNSAGFNSCNYNSCYQYEESCDNLESDSSGYSEINYDYYLITNEGYRDSLINHEIYNLSNGEHSIITNISLQNPSGSTTEGTKYIYIETQDNNFSAEEGDEIVISKPETPPYDQFVVYGGGIGGQLGFPDDGGINNATGTINIGTEEDEQYVDSAKQLFICNLNRANCNEFIFNIVELTTDGSDLAPNPCITGELFSIGYSKSLTGEISQYPNLTLFHGTNIYKFNTFLIQSENTSNDIKFVGKWSKINAPRSYFGEPNIGVSAWNGTLLEYYGGLKSAPEGHFEYPYKKSKTLAVFGGFSQKGNAINYNNNFVISDAKDIYPGWNNIESSNTCLPPPRIGNGIMAINRKIHENDGEIYTFYEDNDLDQEIWLTCGNNGPNSQNPYIYSNSLNDTWMGKLKYRKKFVNTGQLNNIISFNVLENDSNAIAAVKISTKNKSYIVPNGIRTNDNNINSQGDFYSVSGNETNYNNLYNVFSINDVNDPAYSIYHGGSGKPNWIDRVEYDNNDDKYTPSRDSSEIDGYYVPDLDYAGPILGERRWTVLGQLVISIPDGVGSGDYDVYFGVYNNGIDSYVEYFLPEETYDAFALSGIQLSGGHYDECDECDNEIHGKSWFDCTTGILNVHIKNSNHQSFSQTFMPYVKEIYNVTYLELYDVDWFDMTNDIGLKPFKSSWGGLIGDRKNINNIAYFGGWTHGNILIDNLYKYNSPNIFIQDEQSEEYNFADLNGEIDNRWLSLKHGNIIPDGITPKFSETLDQYVIEDEKLAAYGVFRITYRANESYLFDPNKAARFLDVGFKIYKNNNDIYDIDGMGYLISEPTDFYDCTFCHGQEHVFDRDYRLEGLLNFKTGKLFITPYSDSSTDLNSYIDSIKIMSINYKTYEGPFSQKYDIVEGEEYNTYTRTIGDKVGGEYSTRIDSYVYSDEIIDTVDINGFRDDRTWSYELNQGDLSAGYTDITGDYHFEPNKTFVAPAWWTNMMKKHALYQSETQLYEMADELENQELYLLGRIVIINRTEDTYKVQYFKLNKLTFAASCDGATPTYRPCPPVDCDLTDINNIVGVNENNIEYPYDIDSAELYISQVEVLSFEDKIELRIHNVGNITADDIVQIDFMYDRLDTDFTSDNLFKASVDIPLILKPINYMQWQDTEIKTLFSFNKGITWMTYEQSTDYWQEIKPEDVFVSGIDIGNLRDIVSFNWSGWNNAEPDIVRGIISSQNMGFIPGETEKILMLVGMRTLNPAYTPAVNELTFSMNTGFYWEPKNFLHSESGVDLVGDNNVFIRVKMTSPTKTIVENAHRFPTRKVTLRTTLQFIRN